MLLVLGLTIFVDLITAVAVGVVLASIAFVRQVAHEQMEHLRSSDSIRHNATDREIEIMDSLGEKLTVFDFNGPLSFGAAADLGHHARTYMESGVHAIVLDFSRIASIDVSAVQAIDTIATDAKHANRHLYICNASEQIKEAISALNADKHFGETSYHESREEAMEQALKDVGI